MLKRFPSGIRGERPEPSASRQNTTPSAASQSNQADPPGVGSAPNHADRSARSVTTGMDARGRERVIASAVTQAAALPSAVVPVELLDYCQASYRREQDTHSRRTFSGLSKILTGAGDGDEPSSHGAKKESSHTRESAEKAEKSGKSSQRKKSTPGSARGKTGIQSVIGILSAPSKEDARLQEQDKRIGEYVRSAQFALAGRDIHTSQSGSKSSSGNSGPPSSAHSQAAKDAYGLAFFNEYGVPRFGLYSTSSAPLSMQRSEHMSASTSAQPSSQSSSSRSPLDDSSTLGFLEHDLHARQHDASGEYSTTSTGRQRKSSSSEKDDAANGASHSPSLSSTRSLTSPTSPKASAQTSFVQPASAGPSHAADHQPPASGARSMPISQAKPPERTPRANVDTGTRSTQVTLPDDLMTAISHTGKTRSTSRQSSRNKLVQDKPQQTDDLASFAQPDADSRGGLVGKGMVQTSPRSGNGAAAAGTVTGAVAGQAPILNVPPRNLAAIEVPAAAESDKAKRDLFFPEEDEVLEALQTGDASRFEASIFQLQVVVADDRRGCSRDEMQRFYERSLGFSLSYIFDRAIRELPLQPVRQFCDWLWNRSGFPLWKVPIRRGEPDGHPFAPFLKAQDWERIELYIEQCWRVGGEAALNAFEDGHNAVRAMYGFPVNDGGEPAKNSASSDSAGSSEKSSSSGSASGKRAKPTLADELKREAQILRLLPPDYFKLGEKTAVIPRAVLEACKPGGNKSMTVGAARMVRATAGGLAELPFDEQQQHPKLQNDIRLACQHDSPCSIYNVLRSRNFPESKERHKVSLQAVLHDTQYLRGYIQKQATAFGAKRVLEFLADWPELAQSLLSGNDCKYDFENIEHWLGHGIDTDIPDPTDYPPLPMPLS